jgi:hypothetical protein
VTTQKNTTKEKDNKGIDQIDLMFLLSLKE